MGHEFAFFPPYLGPGASGPPVAVLQIILNTVFLPADQQLKVDGLFGEEMKAVVSRFQGSGLSARSISGWFGPNEHSLLRLERGVADLISIPLTVFRGETMWRWPESETLKSWPPASVPAGDISTS
jgi:hypothetical protein